MTMTTWRCPKCGGLDEVTAGYDGPLNCGDCLMARAEMVPMRRAVGVAELAAELEKADNVIRVMYEGHVRDNFTAEELMRMLDDLRIRGYGLTETQKTRAALIQEVIYGG